jgi:multisubunit Na+/H+ antiporter MnhG subunit
MNRSLNSRSRRTDLSEITYLFLLVTFILFAIRDGLTGSIRYLFQITHLEFLWFIPDLLSFVAVGLFVYGQFVVRRNMLGIFFCSAAVLSTVVSIFFMNDTVFSLFSSIKMFIPMFVGFCFYGRSVTERRWVRIILLLIFVASTVALILNPYIQYPWYGQTISAFGMERQATKIWWQAGGVRYGGLAGDSTMAAYMLMFTYVLISPYYGRLANLACWPFIYWGIHVSTSKTALGVFYIYAIIYGFVYLWRGGKAATPFLRMAARASFLCLIAPVAMMVLLHGAHLEQISPSLFSLQDRIDNTWPGPFMTVMDIFAPGVLLGCGLGCFSYPMDYTNMADYNLPLDNFYLATLIMMGLPFLIFIILQFVMIRYARDPTKLTLITLFNFYSATIQCYGPSYATLMFGYIFSEMFRFSPQKEKIPRHQAYAFAKTRLPAELPASR